MAGGANEQDIVFDGNLFPLIRAEVYNMENTALDTKVRFGINATGALVYEADFGAGFIPWGDSDYLTYSKSLTGISDTEFYITGTDDEQASGLTADYNTIFSLGNNHASIKVTALTGSGTITITGTETSEETNVPTAGSEVLTIDSIADYQTDKKWMQIDSIVLAGFTSITYDVYKLGYVDLSNNDFRVMGYRIDTRSQANTADVKIEIFRIKNLGGGKYEKVVIESIGVDSNNGNGSQVDNLRTGGADRSFTFGATAFPNNSDYVFKQGDFFQFHGDEAFILGSNSEGMQVKISGQGDPDISGTDSIVMGVVIIKTS